MSAEPPPDRDDPEGYDEDFVVMPVVVITQTFKARPSALPDAEAFVRENLGPSALGLADTQAVFAAIREAILAAASPDIGSFQITVRTFPDGAEVEVLSSADQPSRRALPDSVTTGSFATWLAGTLRRAGLSQEAAASQLGVSVRTVSRWMRGETEPRLRDLRRVEELLGSRDS